MPRVELRLLGPVEISAGGEPSDLDGGRPRLVLLALFTAEGHQLSTDQLSERCFRDDDRPLDPRPALRTAVHRVRRALGEHAVVTRRGGYQLDLTEITVDVERFETLIAAARGHDVPAEEAIEHLEVALSLWRGRPFGDLDAEWLEPERVRLEELQLIALETWFEAGISSGSATEILPMLESTALVHPLRERFHRQLMLALYLGGRQAEALQVFQRHRDALIEVGLDPGAEVVDLEHRISRGDPSLRTVGAGATSVRGYHLIEQVGDGAFSVVYRATQPSVDREVAVKQIRADLANRPEFIRRFESEAQIVARLEHPHIVPLYDFWREPGSAYLVMRYLRGGSVEDRLRSSPIPLEVVARMVDQVGLALMAAHRVGVIHRDVKPGNILLDDEDNAFLADFGIAIDLNDAVAGSSGATEVFKAATPSYAPPEQLRGEEAGPSSDVFAFGLTVHRALSGSVPSADEPSRAGIDRHVAERLPSVCRLRPEIPTSVDGVLRKATAVEPADRFQSVAAFIAAFRAALGSVATPTAMVTAGAEAATIGVAPVEPLDRNPFKGLRAFGEGDAVDFAGRSRLVDQLLAVLAEHRLVAVVGPSGSGKSSVVRAGLLPAIRHGRVEGSADWFIATMVPSANPVHELAAALSSVASRQAADRSDLLAPDGLGLVRAIRDALPAGGQLLLVIDQFEELFTNAEDESTTRRFLDMLASAVSDAASPLRAVITLRADFFDRPLSHARLGQAMQRAVVPVPPLAPDELERVIVDPAEANGGILEPGLVSQIVADVAGEPGMLPMLQYTLTELWEHRVSGMLTNAAYREMGGVTGALVARAEELHGRLSPDEQQQARQMFARLVTVGPGSDDTKRRVDRSALGAPEHLIDYFGAARLLSFDRDPITRGPTVEVAHEALIAEWPRLRQWIDEDREGLEVRRHLVASTQAWVQGGCDQADVYRGGRLGMASEWLAEHGDEVTGLEREFVAAGKEVESSQRAAETRRRRRQFQMLAGFTVLTTAVALVALVFFTRARNESIRADDEARQANSLGLAAQSGPLLAENPALAVALAAEARELDANDVAMGALFEARLAFGKRGGQPLGDPLLGHTDRVDGVAISPDGRLIASASADLGIRLWDSRSGDPVGEPMMGHTDWVEELAFSPDGSVLASASDDGTVRLWDPRTGRPIGEPLVGHTDFVWSVDFRSDGNLLASGSDDGTVRLWDPRTAMPVGDPLTGHTDGVLGVAFSPDGSRLASASRDGTVRFWDGSSGRPLGTPLVGHEALILALAFSPDGRLLATASGDGTVRVWDTSTGAAVGEPIDGHLSSREVWVFDVAFSPDGRTLASAASDSTIRLWDVESREPLGQPMLTDGGVALALAFAPDGSQLVSSYFDGSVHRWDPTPGTPAERTLAGHDGGVTALAYDPTGQVLAAATGGEEAGIRLWDARSGDLIGEPLSGQRADVTTVTFAPVDRSLAVGSADGTIRVWAEMSKLPDAEPVTFTSPGGSVSSIAFSPDGRLLLSAGDDGMVRFWNPSSGEEAGAMIDSGDGPLLALAFSAQGDRIAAAGADGAVRLWDPATGRPAASALVGHSGPVTTLAFSPDGELLASAGEDRTIRLWAVATGEPVGEPLLAHTDFVWSVAFSPDGTLIASGSRDGTMRLWSADGGTPIDHPFTQHADAVTAVTFSPDGGELASASRAGTVVLLDSIWSIAQACTLIEPFVGPVALEAHLPLGRKPVSCVAG